jgi:hypothetical protein
MFEREYVSLRRREIDCAIIIDAQGRFLLQQRDDVPGILQPVGLFGGHREGSETYLQCVVREVQFAIKVARGRGSIFS